METAVLICRPVCPQGLDQRVALLDKVNGWALSNLIYLQTGLLGAPSLLQTGSFAEQNGKPLKDQTLDLQQQLF